MGLAIVVVLLATLASLAAGVAVPTFVRATYIERTAAQRISNVQLQVLATAGNHVVCVANIRGNDNGGRTTVTVAGEKLSFVYETRMPFPSSSTNTLVAFFYVAKTTGFSNVVITSFASSAGGELHCSEVAGATGLDAYNSAVSRFGFAVNVGITTVCSHSLIIVCNGAATTAIASQMPGVRDSFSPKRGGLSHVSVNGGSVPQFNLLSSAFPSSPSPGAMGIVAIALSGCSTAAPSACPNGTTCECGGSYCIAGDAPESTGVTASVYSKLYASSLQMSSTAASNVSFADLVVQDAPISTGGELVLGGTLSMWVAPSPTPRPVTVVQVLNGPFSGTFSAISFESTDPCFAVTGAPTYTGSGLSVLLTSTAVPGCGVTCANRAPCAHGTCSDTALGPTCDPCPSAGGFGFSGAFCETNVCPADCNGVAHGTCGWVAPAPVPSCSCVASLWTGPDCSTPICTPACENGGTCLPNNPPVCECAAGWQGASVGCTVPIVVGVCPTSCGVGSCSNGTNYTCACPPGYSGSECQQLSCPDRCSNNGQCVASPDGSPPVCNCAPSFTGPACATRQCVAGDCVNNGACSIVNNDDVVCACSPEWTGAACQVPLPGTSRSGLSEGAIAGIAIGCIVAGALVIVGIVLVTNKAVTARSERLTAEIRAKEMENMSPRQLIN